MKKKTSKLIIVLFLIALLATYYYFVHYKNINPLEKIIPHTETPPPLPSYVTSNGELQIIFCPSSDCLNAYLNIISNATISLDCAVYELDHPQIQQAIRDKAKAIPVRIITDDDYYKEFSESYVKKDKGGLMHNKFCIADSQNLLAGSANPTENDMGKNNNNIILTNSTLIIQNYHDEFEELYSGIFKKGEPVKNPQINLQNINIETYFCPEDHCEDHVVEQLQKAKSKIDCMAFSFTSDPIGNALLTKHLDNLSIRCVFEKRQESEYSEYSKLKYQELDVHLDGNKYTMHHKVFIIDNETVITGSFNPTSGGNSKNDENLMIIHSAPLAALYEQEFLKVYTAAIINETPVVEK